MKYTFSKDRRWYSSRYFYAVSCPTCKNLKKIQAAKLLPLRVTRSFFWPFITDTCDPIWMNSKLGWNVLVVHGCLSAVHQRTAERIAERSRSKKEQRRLHTGQFGSLKIPSHYSKKSARRNACPFTVKKKNFQDNCVWSSAPFSPLNFVILRKNWMFLWC